MSLVPARLEVVLEATLHMETSASLVVAMLVVVTRVVPSTAVAEVMPEVAAVEALVMLMQALAELAAQALSSSCGEVEHDRR